MAPEPDGIKAKAKADAEAKFAQANAETAAGKIVVWSVVRMHLAVSAVVPQCLRLLDSAANQAAEARVMKVRGMKIEWTE